MGLPPYGPEPYASANSATPAWLLAKRVSTISEAIQGCKHLFRKSEIFGFGAMGLLFGGARFRGRYLPNKNADTRPAFLSTVGA